MQTQTQIREILSAAGLAPNRALGQNFLIDRNLMGKLLELAEVGPQGAVLEVGPGTGSLTEELAQRARRVVAVEIDRGLSELLRGRLAGLNNVLLLHTDVLAGKHQLSPAVLDALGGRACLVSNLPYSVATPVVAECLLLSRRALGETQRPPLPESQPSGAPPAALCRFDRLTFTVQREVADRMAASTRDDAYGPFSVIVAILAKVTPGPVVPPAAFWPQPSVSSRIVRIDFEPASAGGLRDPAALVTILGLAFGQRRKQIGSLLRRKDCPFEAEALAAAFERAGVDKTLRAEQISPGQYREVANALGRPERKF